jgi:hypothetical protein
MSDTPQTDAFAVKFKTLCGEKYWIPVDIARKLERERDEAMKKIEQQRKEIVRLNGATNHAEGARRGAGGICHCNRSSGSRSIQIKGNR